MMLGCCWWVHSGSRGSEFGDLVEESAARRRKGSLVHLDRLAQSNKYYMYIVVSESASHHWKAALHNKH
jgi:hypothetical protein